MPEHPIIDCPGSAHDNAYVDHCMLCAPRWGKVPAYAGMSEGARWALRVLACVIELRCPGMPIDVVLACEELAGHGYATLGDVEVVGKGTTTNFLVYAISTLGRDAAKRMMRGTK